MVLPPRLKKIYLDRFDELIRLGYQVVSSFRLCERIVEPGDPESGLEPMKEQFKTCDYPMFCLWRSKSTTLLENVTRTGSINTNWVDKFLKVQPDEAEIEEALAHLLAMRDDLDKGFLDELATRIEAEISGDYMGQAEQLLEEGQSGKFDHVPAAVLAGAVLEKSLRTLCDQQQPPIPTTKSDGKPLTMDPLITALKKAGLFNEARAKQLQAFAAIRNHAAHGEFDKFTEADVELMLKGITDFLGTYLG